MTRIRTIGRTVLLAAAYAASFACPVSRAESKVDGRPNIQVVYPRKDQEIGPVDSTFILGSVTPGAVLRINGIPVEVYRTGGFLAYLPVRPGPFGFRLWA